MLSFYASYYYIGAVSTLESAPDPAHFTPGSDSGADSTKNGIITSLVSLPLYVQGDYTGFEYNCAQEVDILLPFT